MHAPVEPVVRFDVFELDTRSGELRKHGRRIRLPEQSFQVLSLLLAHPGEVVMRADLQQRLWPTTTSGDFDSGLNNAVKKLRDALGDSAETPRLIETVPRRGYRFLGQIAPPVPILAPEAEPALARAVQVAEIVRAVAPSRSRFAAWHLVTVLLVALVGGAATYQRDSLATLVSGSSGQIRSIIVLPFDNLTGDASQDYVVDSVSAALTAHLSEVRGLDVISRATARQFTRTDTRISNVGKTVNVEGIVEGEVLRSGADMRIIVRLIRASTDRNVWSRTYAGAFDGLIRLQQQIASDIATAAGHRPQPAVARVQRTYNAQAYDTYLKGLGARGIVGQYEGFQRAAAYFEHAISLQPDFAEAYAELALTRLQFLCGGPVSPHEAIPRAQEAARIAIGLDPTLGQAHWALGRILNLYYWKWEEGEDHLQRAAILPGGRASVMSAPLARRGEFDQALAMALRGRDLDPNSVSAQLEVGNYYRKKGEHDRAIQVYRRALKESPGARRIHFQIGMTFVAMGQLADAIREFETARNAPGAHNTRFEAYLGYAYAQSGRTDDARAILNELEDHRREGYVSAFGFALIHDALQEPELALRALQRAYDEHAVELAMINQYPAFKTIALHPEFQSIMQSVGMPR